jgi:hypothetical protein
VEEGEGEEAAEEEAEEEEEAAEEEVAEEEEAAAEEEEEEETEAEEQEQGAGESSWLVDAAHFSVADIDHQALNDFHDHRVVINFMHACLL